jgi:hypothetical protein
MIMKCTYTPKSFEGKVLEKASFLLENMYNEDLTQKISDSDVRKELYNIFKDVSE